MRLVIDLEEANELLNLYKGATLQIHMFSISLKRLGVKLTLPNENEIVHVIGVTCKHISGPFEYSNAHLSITSEDNQETGDNSTIISDTASDFKLITSGGFSIAQGHELEFGTSFENFFILENNLRKKV